MVQQQTKTKRSRQNYQADNGQEYQSVWAKPVEQVLSGLNTDPGQGLSPSEIAQRKKKWGPNLLKKHRQKSIGAILADQFKSLIIGLLAVAAAAAFWFGEWVEGWAIGVVIVINSMIGFFTELRAVRSMEALFKMGIVKTRVRREGHIREVDAADLVPGDIVVMEGGDVITADIRILEASRLQADESALTGESLPVSKQVEPVGYDTVLAERASMLYKGTAVTRGAGEGVVVATGLNTELGQISSLVEEAEDEQTPLEERLDKLGYRLIFITLFIAVFVAGSGIWAGKDLFLMIETGIALAVAAIPEGLPIVATIALAKGIKIMASRNVLVNRLSSVETLGATGIICTDKTGTLTENKMSVSLIVLSDHNIEINGEQEGETLLKKELNPESHPNLRLLLETGVLCNNASLDHSKKQGSGTGDPLEIALLSLGRKAGIDQDDLVRQFPEEKEEAFDAEVKMMATWNRTGQGLRVHVKGAPGAVLRACDRVQENGEIKPLTPEKKEKWQSINDDLAKDGLRMLALAFKTADDTEKEPYDQLVFLGLIALLDPPRGDIKPAIERCKQAGIRVVMVTGDQVETARYIAKAVGLSDDENAHVIHGNELPSVGDSGFSSANIDKRKILEASIFARISPHQKLDLIEFYQDNGDIIAMTGDGVNDAPALKKADIGIAMGQRGTQVAREASDMVLTDDAFSSIVAAIEQGRIIFGNIRRFIYYLMSCNLSEVMVVGTASLIGTVLPILPLQILFLNLVTDVFPALALGLGEGEEGAMNRPPRPPDEPILDNHHWAGITAYSVLIMGAVLGSLWMALQVLELNGSAAVSISFLTLAIAQLWHVFNMRSIESELFNNTIIQNRWIWAALALCFALLLMAVYIPPFAAILQIQPPGLAGWTTVLGFSLIPLAAGQAVLWLRKE